jgi:hypothetical protein
MSRVFAYLRRMACHEQATARRMEEAFRLSRCEKALDWKANILIVSCVSGKH